MRLYVIRHCQSENNALWSNTGSSNGRKADPALTETGHLQTRYLADYLARVRSNPPANPGRHTEIYPFTHLYSSLMHRAVETGVPLAAATDLPLHTWEEIHEHGGIYRRDPETDERIGLPGPNRAFFETHFPELVLPDGLGDAGWWNRPAESWEDVRQRARRFVTGLLERHGRSDDSVAIVTHGGFVFALLGVLLDVSFEHDNLGEPVRVRFQVNNGSISRFDFDDTQVRMVYFNHTHQFPPELVT